MTQQEIIAELAEYEELFYTDTQRNYVMFGSYDKKLRLSDLYTKIFNKKSNMLNSCGSCALSEMKQLGEYYYKNNKIEEVETEVVEENKPKKRGRKKKIDND